MLDLIIQNKEWLFSGIGVTILVGAFFIVKWLFATKLFPFSKPHISDRKYALDTGITENRNENIEAQLSSKRYMAHPDPIEISTQLKELPPFQQKEAEKNFHGLHVQWSVSLALVHKCENGQVELTCDFPGYSRYVKVKTSQDEYPEIKVMKEGQNISVYGTLVGIDPSGPVVEAHKIEF